MRYLASNDTILILKFPHMVHDSQFWALIPPSNPTKVEKEDNCIAEEGYLKIGNDIEDAKQMTLISLVDRDDIIAQTTDLRSSASSHTRPAKSTGDDDADAEDDVCTMDEFQKYFHDALVTALGPPSPYNPFASPSRKLDALVPCCCHTLHYYLTEYCSCSIITNDAAVGANESQSAMHWEASIRLQQRYGCCYLITLTLILS